MSYQISDLDFPGSPYLELLYPERKRKIFKWILYSHGILFLGIAFYLSTLQWQSAVPIDLIVGYLGILTFASAVALEDRSGTPHKLLFDSKRGYLKVLQNSWDDDDQAAFLPYQEIKGFYCRKHLSYSQDSEKNKPVVTYHVEMRKRDGSVWTLRVFGNKEKAEEFARVLRDRVDLSVPTEKWEASTIGNRLQVEKRAKETSIDWKKKTNWRIFAPVVTIGVGACFMALSVPDFPTIVKIAILVFFGGACCLLPLMSLLIPTYQKVTVDSQQVAVTPRGGLIQRSFKIPIEEVVSVMFNFSVNHVETGITIYTEEQIKDQLNWEKSLSTPSIEAISNIISMARKHTIIETGHMSTVEKIALEQLIQEALHHHGHSLNEEQNKLLELFQELHSKADIGEEDFAVAKQQEEETN